MAISALALSAIIGGGSKLISSGLGFLSGNKQQKEGERMMRQANSLRKNNPRPDYEIPDAVNKMVGLAQGQMFQRLPGATNYENMIQGSTAGALSSLKQMGAGAESMGAIADLYANQMSSFQGLAGQEAGFRQQGQDRYMSALEGLGEYQQKEFQWDKAMPYMDAMQRASQLEAAGRENKMHGYNNKLGVGSEIVKGVGDMFSNPEILKLLGAA